MIMAVWILKNQYLFNAKMKTKILRKLQTPWVRGRLARIFQEDAGETPAYPAKLEVLQFPLLKNAVACKLIAAVLVLFIVNSNIIYAQSDTIESDFAKGAIVGSARLVGSEKATAQLYNPVTREIQMSVNIASSGYFSFGEITPGEYIVNISSPFYMDHPVAISVKEGINVIEEQILKYSRSGSGGNIGYPVNAPAIEWQPSDEFLKREAALGKQPSVSGYAIFTVCELLSVESFQWIHTSSVIIIGNLVQTPEGSWLEQQCGNTLKSGTYSWPDAIFLKKNSSDSKRLTFILEDVDKRFGKEFIQNNVNDDSVAVAVAGGRLIFSDDLVQIKCGEEKTCGFGYGPIAAPMQIDYELMRYLNQHDANTN